MNADPREESGTLPLELADRIDRVCDRFEAALAADQRPRIEEYQREVPEAGRFALLRELLASELEWRRRRGERPTPGEYHERFPSHTALIGAVFDEQVPVAGSPTPRPPTSDARQADREAMTAATPTEGGMDRGEEPLRPGASPLPGYRLIGRLGRGGFGEVWKAEAPGGVPVALKFVRLLDGPGPVERRALETIKGIRHPNLLALFGAWQVGELLVIGMELADGTLMDHFHRSRAEGLAGIPAAELIEYLAEAAKGIDHLNDHIHAPEGRERVGVQHRDIKPQNILLVGGGVKVADFGLARLLDRSVTGHTGSLTPSYAAPEFFQNQTSDRSDQYSLAVTYCQLRGGRLPFTGGPAAIMAGHLHHAPDLTMLPEAERRVVARALTKEPAGRWPSCRAFVAALRSSLQADSPPSSTCEPDRGSDATPAKDSARPDSEPPEPPIPPARRRRGIRAATLVAAPLALGVALWGFGIVPTTRPRSGRVPPPVPGHGEAPGERHRTGSLLKKEAGTLDPARLQLSPQVAPRKDPIAHETRPAPPGPRAAALQRNQGDRHYNDGEFEAAVVAYSEAIDSDPTDAATYNNRGNAYFKLGHHDAAVTDYGEAIRLDPSASVSHFNRGNAYLGMDQFEQAIRDFTAAIQKDPRNSDAYANRASAHERLGDHGQATSDRAQAARLESESSPTPK